jgi:hypothetical protein
MNESIDPLETELRSLRPLDLSSRARQRIKSSFEVNQPAAHASLKTFGRWSAPISGLVAVCLIVAIALRPSSIIQPTDTALSEPQVQLTAAFDDALPTAWTYHRALLHSSHEAESLLDKHAAIATTRRPSPAPIFVRSHPELLLNGEL